MSALCYLSISIAVALPDRHDRILMGPFPPVPLSLNHHSPPKPSTHPLYPVPACTPIPLCRTKSSNPRRRGAVWLTVSCPPPPRDCGVQMLEGVIENKTKLKQRDPALLCARAVNISEWLSCILLASTLFFGQPCGEGWLVAGRR